MRSSIKSCGNNFRIPFASFWITNMSSGRSGIRSEAAPSARNWRERFYAERRRSRRALESGDVSRLLAIVFRRLYVLRSQIFHGGTTFAEG